jgi:hypothetical protein
VKKKRSCYNPYKSARAYLKAKWVAETKESAMMETIPKTIMSNAIIKQERREKG